MYSVPRCAHSGKKMDARKNAPMHQIISALVKRIPERQAPFICVRKPVFVHRSAFL